MHHASPHADAHAQMPFYSRQLTPLKTAILKTWACNELRQSRTIMSHDLKSNSSPFTQKSHLIICSQRTISSENSLNILAKNERNNLIRPLYSINHFWLINSYKCFYYICVQFHTCQLCYVLKVWPDTVLFFFRIGNCWKDETASASHGEAKKEAVYFIAPAIFCVRKKRRDKVEI